MGVEPENYRVLYENMPLMYFTLDIEGTILSVNPLGAEQVGYTVEELVGKPILTVIHEEDSKTVQEQFLGILQNVGQVAQFEVRKIHQNGDVLWVQMEAFAKKRNGGGIVIYAAGHAITERKQTKSNGEKRVLERIGKGNPFSNVLKERLIPAMFESFFNHAADAMAVFDLEGHVVQLNPAYEKIFGWTAQEVAGQKLPSIPQNLNHEMEKIYEEVKRGGQIIGLEMVRERKDGQMIDVSVTYSPVRDAKGNVVAVSGIARDITDRKKTEELLRKSDRLSVAGQLAAGIAHEIRNPLTVLKGFVQLLQSKIDQDYYKIMISELDRINLIVSELLMLAKPQLTRLQNEDLRILLLDVIALLNPQAILNHIQIATEFESDIPLVKCEANQLKQAFINLIKNAIDAMPRGGEIGIQVKRQDPDHILIRFMDQGEGIPEERISRLGEPFYTTKEKGTGLGLMVSFRIIKDHGGSIQVMSQVGQGTTVDVVLPVFPDTANGHPA